MLNTDAVKKLEVMISKIGQMDDVIAERLHTGKDEVKALRVYWEKKDACKAEFFQRAKGVDEKKSWNIF